MTQKIESYNWMLKEYFLNIWKYKCSIEISRSNDGSESDKEIFMYDVTTESVSKLAGDLSTAFVDAAESNSDVDEDPMNDVSTATHWQRKTANTTKNSNTHTKSQQLMFTRNANNPQYMQMSVLLEEKKKQTVPTTPNHHEEGIVYISRSRSRPMTKLAREWENECVMRGTSEWAKEQEVYDECRRSFMVECIIRLCCFFLYKRALCTDVLLRYYCIYVLKIFVLFYT